MFVTFKATAGTGAPGFYAQYSAGIDVSFNHCTFQTLFSFLFSFKFIFCQTYSECTK